MKTIIISASDISLLAHLNDSSTAQVILAALPIEGIVNRWGDEIYFDIPITMGLAPEAKTDMKIGELAYWPSGRAFCIFFGPTPVSRDEHPRAAGKVNPLGQISGDATQFRAIKDGTKILLKHSE